MDRFKGKVLLVVNVASACGFTPQYTEMAGERRAAAPARAALASAGAWSRGRGACNAGRCQCSAAARRSACRRCCTGRGCTAGPASPLLTPAHTPPPCTPAELQNKYGGKGLEILAFPCNQFGAQEPGSNSEVKSFAERKGFKGPMFAKVGGVGWGGCAWQPSPLLVLVLASLSRAAPNERPPAAAAAPPVPQTDVNGPNAEPLFGYLKKEQGGLLNADIKWNFSALKTRGPCGWGWELQGFFAACARGGRRPGLRTRRALQTLTAGSRPACLPPPPCPPPAAKFLVDKSGKVVKRYGSATAPLAIENDIKSLL